MWWIFNLFSASLFSASLLGALFSANKFVLPFLLEIRLYWASNKAVVVKDDSGIYIDLVCSGTKQMDHVVREPGGVDIINSHNGHHIKQRHVFNQKT